MKQELTYLQAFMENKISFSKINIENLFKCIFLIWLMVPGTNGGTYLIYNRIIRPFVIKHQSTIDKQLNSAKDAAGKSEIIIIIR